MFCYNCFSEKGNYDVCPKCGFLQADDRREIYHLPAMTMLEDKYVIGRVVNFGGFGIVYKAWNTLLNIEVAIKEYYPAGMVNRAPGTVDVVSFQGEKAILFENGKNRFLEEARNMAKFNDDEHIVKVYDYFKQNNTAYIVMEFLEGQDLKQYLEQAGGKLSYEETVELMLPVMGALHKLHRAHIIHRDISPDNIYVTSKNVVKLIDFGTAKFEKKEKAENLSGIVVKTGYAPPEQYEKNGKQGPWTDIYALGATLYRMVTGEIPEESVDRAVNKKERLKRPSELGAKLPETAQRTIMKAMAIRPSLRFDSVETMATAFAGKKKIDYPEIELAKRVKRRIAISATLFVLLMTATLGSLHFYFNMSIDAAQIPATEIVVWVPGEEGEAAVENAIASFSNIAENSDFDISVGVIDEDQYEELLLSVYGTEQMPDLFRTDLLSEVSQELFTTNVDLYFMYATQDTTYFVEDDVNDLKADEEIPSGFKFPVVYVNRGLLAKMGQDTPSEFETVESLDYDISKLTEKYEITTNVVYDEDCVSALAAAFGVSEAELLSDANIALSQQEALELFVNQEAVMYVGYTDELSDIQAIQGLAISYDIVPIITESMAASYTATYGISNESSQDEKRLSMLFLYYLSAQNDAGSLALDKDSLATFVESNDEFFDFLLNGEAGVAYMDRLTLKD